ncbi:hypothetical protein PINS_up009848 [Pythium insidiosum]|nr:hypothetical protein PINS_up009848 [Pythium insidiosum]
MSRLLPRVWPNRFFIVLLVLNCWKGAVIYRLSPQRQLLRRLVHMLLDVVMDMVTMTALPVYLLLGYVRTFNFADFNFTNSEWYNDVWMVNFMHESQFILASSWVDVSSRVLLSTNVLTSLEAVSDLELVSRDPALRLALARRLQLDSTVAQRFHRAARYLLAVWGAAVLVLHLRASHIHEPAACRLHVRPWLATRPSCALLDVNCQVVTDDIDAVASAIDSVDPDIVVHLRVRHCVNVEMPPSLQRLAYLVGLKIYNATVRSWPTAAALTSQHHDRMRYAFFPRVVFPNATLPAGLVSLDFPPKLNDLEFCGTNIAWIADDVALAWASVQFLYMEQSPLTAVPSAFIRLPQLQYLSMADDLITDIPMALLESPERRVLAFGGNPIATLPDPDPTNLPPGAYSIRNDPRGPHAARDGAALVGCRAAMGGRHRHSRLCCALERQQRRGATPVGLTRAVCVYYRYGADRPAALYPLHLEV